jgi:hypothetical protein
MANKVRNRLIIKAAEPRLKEIVDFLAGEPDDYDRPRYIDFEKILPIPEALDPVSRDIGELGLAFLEQTTWLGYTPAEVKAQFDALDPDTKNECLKLGQRYRDNKKKYGHPTANEWRRAFWGTKSNGFNQEKRADNEIWFDTAWSGVGVLIATLSLKYPDTTFQYTFADEDTGCNCGFIEVRNGVFTATIPETGTKEAYEIAFEMRPEIRVMFTFDGKTYQYRKES